MKVTLRNFAAGFALILPSTAMAEWSGPYAGLSFGFTAAAEYSQDDGVFAIDDSRIFGAFAGYQSQSGSLVFGAELAITNAPDAVLVDAPEFSILAPNVDLKGRLGYDLGDILAYGVVGMSRLNVASSDEEAPGNGPNIAFGVDYQVSDQLAVGAEYLVRRIEGRAFDEDITTDLDDLSLRASFRF
ncbi:MAG: outer membrane beta-barrel protein [Pseudomonadota bacterium]